MSAGHVAGVVLAACFISAGLGLVLDEVLEHIARRRGWRRRLWWWR